MSKIIPFVCINPEPSLVSSVVEVIFVVVAIAIVVVIAAVFEFTPILHSGV